VLFNMSSPLLNDKEYIACENCRGRSMTFRNSKKKRGPLRLLFNKCLTCDGIGLGLVTKNSSIMSSLLESKPLIAISGCGIGGMALAIALIHRGHKVLIFERDTHFSYRKQGYGLTIQQGMHALSQLGLTAYGISSTAHFSISPDGTMLGCYGRALTKDTLENEDITFSTNAEIRHNIHLPRQRLRALLLNALPPETVKWGVTVDDFEEIEIENKERINMDHPHLHTEEGEEGGGGGGGGRRGGGEKREKKDNYKDNNVIQKNQGYVRLKLSTNEMLDCAVLVGADGIFSNIRKLKAAKRKSIVSKTVSSSNDTQFISKKEEERSNIMIIPDPPLVYLGCIVILGYATITHPLFSHRIVQVLDGNNRIYTMPFSGRHGFATCFGCEGDLNDEKHNNGTCQDSTMWQFSFPVETLEEARELSAKGPAFLRQETIRRCASWRQPILALLEATRDEDVSGYPAFDRPLSPRPLMPPSLSRVVLLGDAAHPMSPFKGQGANQALLDGLALAKWIHESEIGWPQQKKQQQISSQTTTLSSPSTSTSTLSSGKKRGRCNGDVKDDDDHVIIDIALVESNLQNVDVDEVRKVDNDCSSKEELEKVNQKNETCHSPLMTVREVILEKPYVAPNCSVLNPFFKDTIKTPTIQEALAYFEEEMMIRVTPKVKQSRDAVAALHSPSALAPANCTRATAALVLSASDQAEKRRYELGVLSEEQFNQAREALFKALEAPIEETRNEI
jgi:salicylate hydroxylase